MNIFQSIHEYLIIILNIYKEYEYISLWLCLNQEKEFFGFFWRKKKISGICELFANTSHLTDIIPIPIRKFWNSQTIPIPIPIVQKLAPRIYSYSYSREKLDGVGPLITDPPPTSSTTSSKFFT